MDDFNLKEKEVFEAMKRETKLIPHMMKNVVKDDYDDNNEKDKSNDQRVGNSLLQDNERTASNSVLSKVGKGASFWEDGKAANETIPKYDWNDVASESDSAAFNKNKKDGFNIKGKVSNLTKSFSFKGKIFGKKAPSAWESNADIFNCVSPTETVPTVVRNLGELQDNPTEVPPKSCLIFQQPNKLPSQSCISSRDSLCEGQFLTRPWLPLKAERINQPEKLGSKGTEEWQPKRSLIIMVKLPALKAMQNHM
ncbi:hypothetical protein HPP92_022379 [Vanilla planifolia]|uniref:Uncharacterized protein n=1 Tax=Vanilla planifolia TaxID=51239 RepID=A0A835UH62_VANPL|nr:hypothetical protein HPP92_022379 [Vanilla planifolia]